MRKIVFNVPDCFCAPGQPFLVESIYEKGDEVTLIGKELPIDMLMDGTGSFIRTSYRFEFVQGGLCEEDYLELVCDVVRRVKLRNKPIGIIMFKNSDYTMVYEFSPIS